MAAISAAARNKGGGEMNHTDECVQATEAAQKAQEAWAAQWPNHCKTCKGVGGWVDTFDPSPAGVPLGAGVMHDCDPCPDCVERGICPRCGQPGLTDEERGDDSTGEGPCKQCGWNHDDALPELPECWCDARQLYEQVWAEFDMADLLEMSEMSEGTFE